MDYEKLGLFYLGRPYDLASGSREDGLDPLRLARPRHARRLRRHDRQRQDRACASRCSKKPRSTASRRSSSIRRAISEPAAHVPGPGAGGLPPVDQRGRCAAEGHRRPTRSPQRGGAVEEGAGEVGAGRRAHRSACATRPTSRSTRRAARPASRSRSCSRSPRRRSEMRDDAELLRERVSDDGDEPARAARASTPTRSSRASTSCSRRSSTRVARRAATSTSPR